MSAGLVHVVDDDEAMRDSLRFMLEAADLAVRVYPSGDALLAENPLGPGCVITDVRMPGMTGLDLVEAMKRAGAPHPVIVLTGHADVALAVEAMKAGVVDFLEKPFDEETLLGAVRSALARGRGDDARRAERSEIAARVSQLTPRERDVYEAIVAGDTNKSAALRLGISPRTVEIYRAHVMEKMKARTLSDLVRMALQIDQA